MANEKNLKPFPKGTSGNPGGQSKLVKKVKRLGKEQFAEMAELLLESDFDQIKKIAENAKSKMLKRWMAVNILEGFEKADWPMLDSILNRLIGKPKEDIQVTSLRKVVRKLDGTEIVYTNEEE